MADTEFGQYSKSYEQARKRRKHEKKLEDLLTEDVYYGKIGTLRSLLAPEDTLAFPPEVLSTDVYRDWDLPDRLERTAGLYNLGISSFEGHPPVPPWIEMYPYHHLVNPYKTLLHEGGHARDFSRPRNTRFERYVDPEAYADALADSILGGR